MAAKKEYAGGIDFTSFIDKDGFQHSLTARKETSAEAYADLQETIALAIEEGATPFVKDYNKANEQPTVAPPPVSVVEHAVAELGGVEIQPEPIQNFPVDVADSTDIGDGTQYLGLKASKLDNIGEGQSYEVMANCYDFDASKGWVNLYNGNRPAAGHYYNSSFGESEFKRMFPLFVPVNGANKSPIPTGAVKLYVVGVRNKKNPSDTKIYQNIKSVEPA